MVGGKIVFNVTDGQVTEMPSTSLKDIPRPAGLISRLRQYVSPRAPHRVDVLRRVLAARIVRGAMRK
jgi:hypothetical protein